jgi:hypothetical protein
MRRGFEERTSKSCWETVAAGRYAADVAAELGPNIGAVYAANLRILNRLWREMQGLLDLEILFFRVKYLPGADYGMVEGRNPGMVRKGARAGNVRKHLCAWRPRNAIHEPVEPTRLTLRFRCAGSTAAVTPLRGMPGFRHASKRRPCG